MTISVFNGSPRGEKSNTTVINKWIIEGLGGSYTQHLIKKIDEHENYIELMKESEKVVITFPLYTDAMPGIEMKFFEEIYKNRESLKGTKYMFIIHSGFPEAKQSYGLRDYLIRFVDKVDGELFDVVINGGSEGVRLQPENSQKKKREAFIRIGEAFKKNTRILSADKDRLLKPIKLSKFAQVSLKLLSKTPLLNVYWDNTLKKNNAFEKRFDKPYLNKD